ncbi:hypothetical protein KA005_71740, partial [bacterium]|nr:hypothetical protein [bacterium]
MNAIKKHIIFFLSLLLVVPYGCGPKHPPLTPHISPVSDGVTQDHSQEKNLGEMSFLLPSGEENVEELKKVTAICAAENEIDLSSAAELNFGADVASGSGSGAAGSIVGSIVGSSVVIGGPIGLAIGIGLAVPFSIVGALVGSGMGSAEYDSKIKPYRQMQICMEQRGYICAGFCPDKKHQEPPKNCEDIQDTKKTYLAHNVWVSYTDQQYFINYKEGKMLPAGTEVIETSRGDGSQEEISFTVIDTCEEVSIGFVSRWHPGKTVSDYHKLLFTNKTFEELTAGLDKDEIEAIKKGRLAAGMSKRAVLIAYGYPPEYRTPDHVNSNIWRYLPIPRKSA